MDVRWLVGAALGLLLTTSAVGTEALRSLGHPSPPATLTAPSSSRLGFLDFAAAAPPARVAAPRAARLGMSPTRSGEVDCSTGFAVLTRSGHGRLLSAEHCDPTGDRRWYDRDGRLLTRGGDAVDVAPEYDSMLIDPVGRTEGFVYGGPWNAGARQARYRLAVTGAAPPGIGEVVCASGANSGEHCGLTVVDRVLVACPDAPLGVCPAWQLSAPPGGVATVGGDSGGPVYRDNGAGTVSARGIVNSGAATVRCPSTASPPYGRCFREAFFIGIPRVLGRWRASIQVPRGAPSLLLPSVGLPVACRSGTCPPGRPHRIPGGRVLGCRALRQAHLHRVAGVSNPCAQATHLLRLFAANQESRVRAGYLVAVGKLGRTGARLVVIGDVAAARRRLAGDSLVATVHSMAQGS